MTEDLLTMGLLDYQFMQHPAVSRTFAAVHLVLNYILRKNEMSYCE